MKATGRDAPIRRQAVPVIELRAKLERLLRHGRHRRLAPLNVIQAGEHVGMGTPVRQRSIPASAMNGAVNGR